MLDFLRQRAGSWLVKIILGAIIIVFIFWGVGTFRTGKRNILAEVNGAPITFEEFQALYAQKMNQLRNLFGPNLNDELLKRLNLPAQVFEDLVRRKIMLQVAEKMGVQVSTKELQLAISQIPMFQTNGRFDPQKYRLILRELRLAPKDFEEMIRAEFIEAKIRHMLLTPIRATSFETKEWYSFENEKIKLLYAKLPISNCEAEVKVTEDKLKKYYEANKEKYRTKLKIALTYYLLPFKELEKELKISEEDLKNYYESHKNEFTEPEKRKIRHILITKKKNETEEEFLARAQKIRKKIKSAEDFAKVAAKYSDDPHSKKEGGDLGWVTANEVFENLREVIFSAREGEILGPVRSPMGYHIILVEKIKPAKTKPLSQVKAQIEQKLKEQKLKAYAWDKAEKLYDEIILTGGLEAWAKKEHKKLVTTPEFVPANPPEDPNLTPEVIAAAQRLTQGEMGSLMEVPNGIIIFKLAKKEPPHIPPFDKVKDKVKQDFVREEAAKLCGKKAEKILSELKKGNLEQISQKYGLNFKETDFFPRKETQVPGIPQEVLSMARGLGKPGEWISAPILAKDAFYFVKLSATKPADLKEFEKEKKNLQELLTAKKRKEAFDDWYQALRERAQVKLYHELPKL
ncbi:SurA N-terminal domain-containing protein [Thermodesulfatator atlanticus]